MPKSCTLSKYANKDYPPPRRVVIACYRGVVFYLFTNKNDLDWIRLLLLIKLAQASPAYVTKSPQ